MLTHQDKYAEVTSAVFEIIKLDTGFTAEMLYNALPQYNQGLITRSIKLLVDDNKIYLASSLSKPVYFTTELPF